MKKWVFSAAAAAMVMTAGPAQAQDMPEETREEIARGLDQLMNDPDMPDRMAAMTVALANAMKAMPVGQIKAAIEGREPTEAEKAQRLDEELDFDEAALADQTREAMVANREHMQRSMRAMLLMMPIIASAAESMGETMGDAMREAGEPLDR